MALSDIIIKLSLAPSWLADKLLSIAWRRSMRSCGRGVYLRPLSSDIKGIHNLSVGDGTSIPRGSTFYCTEAPLTIGRKVIFGPRPTIITGDHRTEIIGRHIIDITASEKLPVGRCQCDYPERCRYRPWKHHRRRCCRHPLFPPIQHNRRSARTLNQDAFHARGDRTPRGGTESFRVMAVHERENNNGA